MLLLHYYFSTRLVKFFSNMNIDKFGHHVHKRLRLDQSLVADITQKALIKSPAGDFDLHSTTLKGVRWPTAPDDVVNKDYVDKTLHLHSDQIKIHLLNYFTQIQNQLLTRLDEIKENNEQVTSSKRNPQSSTKKL